MKKTVTGIPINRNGKPIITLTQGQILLSEYKGQSFKDNGTYYFFVRKQQDKFIYSP